MGAAQSNRGRGERRRKKKIQTSDFDVPRSASADVIRTLSTVSASPCPCPHCQQMSIRRTFSGSLARSGMHNQHQCLHEHHENLDNVSGDGCEPCSTCPASRCFFRSMSSTSSEAGRDRSTMSLNRNLVGRSWKIAQSQSSDCIGDLLDAMRNSEDTQFQRSVSLNSPLPNSQLLPQRSVSTSESGVCSVSPSSEMMTSTTSSVTTTAKLTAPSGQSMNTPRGETVDKKPVSILEDEESRLARWEKQKLMAQQLRTLRRHIQEQEAVSPERTPPFPVLTNTLSPEQDTMLHSSLSESLRALSVSSAGVHLNNPRYPGEPDAFQDSGSSSTSVLARKPPRSKFTRLSNYRYLDNHPLLSKLQNEQNFRLESMERRMREIRISAMREAERRKFAEIFPAREDNSESERMLQQAREALKVMNEEKRKRKEQMKGHTIQSQTTDSEIVRDQDSRVYEDSGEIIPVHIVPKRGDKCSDKGANLLPQSQMSGACDKDVKSCERGQKAQWLDEVWPKLNLGHPLTWLILPFLMFPLLLRMLLLFIVGTNTSSVRRGSGSGSSSSSSGINSRHRRGSSETARKRI